MKTIGNFLRDCINRSGHTNYGIAKLAGINRTTLQKILTGDRYPSDDLINRLLPHLRLTPDESEELFSLLEMHQVGESVYLQRRFIQDMLESDSAFPNYKKSIPEAARKTESAFQADFNNEALVQGSANVEHLLIGLAQKECYNSRPEILINVPGNSVVLNRVLARAIQYCTGIDQLKVIQLICFNKHPGQDSSALANLEIISNILPFVSLPDFQYHIYYYYDHYIIADTARTAFPYYIVFSSVLVLLSADLCTALPLKSSPMIYYFKNHFEAALQNTHPLITRCANAEDILPLLIQMDEHGSALYTLEYQPCFPAYVTPELAASFTNEAWLSGSGCEKVLEAFLYRARQLKSMEQHTSIFSKSGLLDFTNTGILADFPPEYANPLSPEARKYLLTELYQEIESERQRHRMVNPVLFSIPKHLTCVLHQNRGIEFNGFSSGTGNYIHIEEQTLLEAFSNFFQYLADSPLVCPKEVTLDFIGQCIHSLSVNSTCFENISIIWE